MLKKITSFLLLIILVTGSVYAEDTSYFQGIEVSTEIEFLRSLSVIKETDLKTDTKRTITRGEFATLIFRAMNQETGASAANYSPLYNDVAASHPDFLSIMHMTQFGFFTGRGNNNFEPDAEVTMYEAIKIAVMMCGYDKIMDKSAGYPNAYLTEASRRGLLRGLAETNGDARRADVYLLIYNTLHTDIVDIISFGSQFEFAIQKNVTILTKYWELIKAQGIVTADNFTAIEGKKTIKKGAVTINGVDYLSGTDKTIDKVGRRVRFYYRHDEDTLENTIWYIEDSGNAILSLTADIIERFDYQGGRYTILENDRERHFSVGNKYLLSYNGDPVEGSNQAYMLPNCGTITLIDNDDDGIYNVVIISEYYNLVVDRYDKTSDIIFDKNGRHVKLLDYDIISAGFEFSRLTENGIISVFKSKDSLRMFLSTAKVTGTVTGSETDKELIITVDGAEYSFSRDIKKDAKIISVGNDYTFYIDYFGQIASFELGTDMDYGYIMSFSRKEDLSKQKQVQILDASGNLAEIDLADKVTVSSPSGDITYTNDRLAFLLDGDRFVLYNRNKNRQINKIVLPITISTEDEYYNLPDYPLYKMDYFISEWPDSAAAFNVEYKQEIKGFRNWLIYDEKAIVFQVPLMLNQDYYNEDQVNVIGIAGYPDKENVRVNKDIGNIGKIAANDNEFLVYKVGNDTIAPNILLNFRNSIARAVVMDAHPSVVTRISTVYDENLGETTYRLGLYRDGSFSELNLAEESLNTRAYLMTQNFSEAPAMSPNKRSLAAGDIIRYATDKNNNISTLMLIYDAENKAMSYASKTGFDGLFRVINGTVHRISGNFLEMKLPSGVIERTNIGTAKVVVCDLNSKEPIRAGTVADISPTNTIAVYSRYVVNRLVVVYK